MHFGSHTSGQPQRNQVLDFLRFLGLVIIMAAHSNPPALIFQLRNFGSPLLIVASGLTVSTIYRRRHMAAGEFVRRRLSRITFAVWTFLTIFFALMYAGSHLTRHAFPFDAATILSSYTLYDGIGYVWIFKVYVTLALITPFALWFKKRVASPRRYFLAVTLAYAVYEIVLIAARAIVPAGPLDVLNNAVFVAVPYSLLFMYGLRLDEARRRDVLLTAVFAGLVFAVMAVTKYREAGVFVQTQDFKYPPRLYYLSYAMMALNVTYLASARLLSGRLNPVAVTWLSSKSLWIYLWHILGVYLWDMTMDGVGSPSIWLFKGCFILGFGVSCTLVQTWLVEWLADAVPDMRERGLVAVLR